MTYSKKWKVTLIVIFLFPFIILQTDVATAISRGEVVYEIMSALELPIVQGDSEFVDVPKTAQYGNSVQAAKALGILQPFEHFHPTLEATNAEALMFAVRALGLFNEAEILSKINESSGSFMEDDIPIHLITYITIAKEMKPQIHDDIISSPKNNITRDGLDSLINWLRMCKNGLVFEKEFQDSNVTVTIHREGLGRPPKFWLVLVDEIPLNAEARASSLVNNLKNMGLPAFVVRQEWAFQVSVGPFVNYTKAYEVMSGLPKSMRTSIIPYDNSDQSPALFWAAISFDITQVTPKIALASTKFETSKPISLLAEAASAQAAVNGGYFSGTKPIGLVIIDGNIVYMPYKGRTAIGWDNSDKIFISQVKANMKVRVSSSVEFAVEGVNISPTYHGITVYTPEFGLEAKGIQSDALEVMVRNGKITWKQSTATSNRHYIPQDGFLLIARGKSRQFFASVPLGTELLLTSSLEPEEFNHVKWAFQAGPLILANGVEANVNEGFKLNFIDKRHPRTLWGANGSKIYWVVVDGRDPWHSRGVTLSELKSIARRLGIKDAVNLDGGGSSGLWWNGVLINHSPGGRERPLPYIIYLD